MEMRSWMLLCSFTMWKCGPTVAVDVLKFKNVFEDKYCVTQNVAICVIVISWCYF